MTSFPIHSSDPTLFTHLKQGVQKNGGQTFQNKALPNDYTIVSIVRRILNIIGACFTGFGLCIAVPLMLMGSLFHKIATPGKVYAIINRTCSNQELEQHLNKIVESERKLKVLHLSQEDEGSLEISKKACSLINKILPETLIFNHIELLNSHEKWLESSTHYYLPQKNNGKENTIYVLRRKISVVVLSQDPQEAISVLRRLAQVEQRVLALHYMAPLPEEYLEECERLLNVIRPTIQTHIVSDAKLTPGRAIQALARLS